MCVDSIRKEVCLVLLGSLHSMALCFAKLILGGWVDLWCIYSHIHLHYLPYE